MENKLKAGILAWALAFMPLTQAGESKKPLVAKPSIVATHIHNESANPINRLEVFGKLPLSSDFYAIGESQDDSDFYKLRVQALPLSYGAFSVGAVAQHVNGNKFSEHNEYGIVTRVQGKPTEKSFGKLDLRYFPDRETIDGYGFIDTNRVFLDCLGSYDHETGNGFVRPGIDIKLGKNVSLGLETKFSGYRSNLDKQYFGLRGKVSF